MKKNEFEDDIDFEEKEEVDRPAVKYLYDFDKIKNKEQNKCANKISDDIVLNNSVNNTKNLIGSNKLKEYGKSEKLIFYDGKTGKYATDGKIPIEESTTSRQTMKNKILKEFSMFDLEKYRTIIKYVDFYVYNIIKQEVDKGKLPADSCKQYLNTLLGVQINKLPFQIRYDLSYFRDNKKLNFFEKIKIKKIIAKHKKMGIALVEKEKNPFGRIKSIIENKKSIKGLLAGIGAGALVLSGGSSIANIEKNSCEEFDIKQNNRITEEYDNMEHSNENKQKTENYTEYKNTLIDRGTLYNSLKTEKSDEERETEITTGDTVFLNEGVKYYENSLEQGKNGEIGKVQWRPEGEYTIDGIAVVTKDINGNLKFEAGTYGKTGISEKEFVRNAIESKKLKEEDVEVMYHLGYTEKDNAKTGWTKKEQDGYKIVKKYVNSHDEEDFDR